MDLGGSLCLVNKGELLQLDRSVRSQHTCAEAFELGWSNQSPFHTVRLKIREGTASSSTKTLMRQFRLQCYQLSLRFYI